MKIRRTVIGLSWLIALLALPATLSGLLWQNGESFLFTTIRGETIPAYGRGLYAHDSLFVGAGNKGTDLVALVIGIPLLVITSMLYRRGSIRGGLLPFGVLAYFLYVYMGYALGTTFLNELFFVYVALFSASLYAFILLFLSFDLESLPAYFSPSLPRYGPAIVMIASGLVTAFLWAAPVAAAQLQGRIPDRLDHYTTLFTYALDLAVITPATFVAGFLILRRSPAGYLIAISLLVL